MSELQDRLRELREDPPGEAEFTASLHRRLAEAGAPDPLPWWRRLLGERPLWPVLTGASAFAAIAIAALVLMKGAPHALPAQDLVVTRLPATKVAVVRVNLSAEVDVASAQIRVELPEGLVFWNDGHELPERHIEWTQPLNSGDNELPIAVRGLRPGRYKMTVSALIGTERVLDEVELQVVDG